MKLGLTNKEIATIVDGEILRDVNGKVDILIYDTRMITSNRAGVFFALQNKRNGHIFCQRAYDKGVRCFVVSEEVELPNDTCIIKVEDTLCALQTIAKYHRNQFSYPVLAVTGSLGKTMIKEWLYFLIKDHYKVVRSPKSYNSQLGVAISLLEMTEKHDFAIIEADISHPDEMTKLEEMISPTLGVFTGVGKNYEDNFESKKQHNAEHLKLFKHANITFALNEEYSTLRRSKINAELTEIEAWDEFRPSDSPFAKNITLALFVATFLGVSKSELLEKIKSLPKLSDRLEVFEGQNDNLIINDTYNIDIDALEQSLEYQFSSDERQKKVVVLDLSSLNTERKEQILSLVESYKPDEFFIIKDTTIPKELKELKGVSILFKGPYDSPLKELVKQFKNRKHETWVEFDLKAVKHNIDLIQAKLQPNTQVLVMVKASSYGTGDVNIPHFLQQIGVDYLGVAYTDEGTTLREKGIQLPILVMNTEQNAFDDITKFCLEPSIFDMKNLIAFREHLLKEGLSEYPIHLTFETGMNRLGFDAEDLPELLEYLRNQQEIKVKSVYSHLADADNTDSAYTENQIQQFQNIKEAVEKVFSYRVLFHILNSEGASKFGDTASFDMVRLGIGVFGYTSTAKENVLLPSMKWKTTISQIKTLKAGETVGYGRSYKVDNEIKIATLRIGYADGFRRNLSNGVGKVFINGKHCPVVGNVCMDMTMVDVSNVDCEAGDEVEIIGDHIDMETFSKHLGTIPYEVMTSINKRVARIYLR
ncbi:MAG: alanine racemase [Fluviicola sp.]|nr:MAG: alanine racemase [Fluviicola sp.]